MGDRETLREIRPQMGLTRRAFKDLDWLVRRSQNIRDGAWL